ncbi:MAG TPA: PocR ligand-binding domain-containing protein [Bryobacteraceae bacterium]|nr:PocR ligand-binding domain-containing protein [Bryobacteraceae bacterium]
MRRTGIQVIGDVPWGTHFCQFYENEQDLVDILVPYFKAGLENNEFCMWITSEPLRAEQASAALAAEVGDLDEYIRNGQIEILDYREWYTVSGSFDSSRVLQGWVEKVEAARSRGFDGLRLTGNTFWLEKSGWNDFTEYEAAVDGVIGQYPMLAMCTYSLAKCGAVEIMDVVSNHAFALIKRAGEWHIIESAERKRIEASLRESEESLRSVNAELEARIRDQYRQQEWLRVTLSSIGDAVLATDTAGKITFLNPIAAELLGWAQDKALGLPVRDVLHIIDEQTRKRGEDIVARVLQERCVLEMANHSALISRDGREIPIEDSAAPIQDSAGNLAGVVLVFHDVTEKRRAQQAVRESEQRVRLKLDAILSPGGDIGKLDLGDIVDARGIQSLLDDFYKMAGIPMAIVDLNGKVLVGVGWQEICTRYHRVHPDTCKNCIESDTELSAGVLPGQHKLYKCRNNMWDIVTPLIVGGEHVGNLFSGQFFFDDEPLDREFFRSQAHRFGFPEADYLAALDSVPQLSRDAVETAMCFLMKLGHMLSLLSYSNLKLARSLAERDALTASLKRSGETLSRAQEIAHLGSWELDLASDRLSWSDEVYRIFGLQPQEFGATYEAFLKAVHPDDRAAVDAAYSGSLSERKSSYEITHRVVRRNTGEVRWVHEKCEHIRDASGSLMRSVGMVQDITESRQAEQELQQAFQQRRLALEAAEMGAWDFRLDTGEVCWDQRARDMFGVAAGDQIKYTEAISRIHPEDRPITDQAVKEAIAGAGGGAYHREFRVVWPDASVHWVASLGRVYFEGQGQERRAVRFIGANMDITERKRAEENLRQAQKLESIGLLAGGIAHDFNNLLVGVIGNASLAQDMIPSGSPALKVLKRIIEAGEHAANLTRQMLAYAGKGRFVLEPVNLSELVRSTRALLQSSISKKITWQFHLESVIPAVESDPGQMQQVLMNLVFNAGEAIGTASGVISIETGERTVDAAYITRELDGWAVEPGRYVFLYVSDTGCGMDQATMAKVFDPFFTTKFQGRGLGLAAVAGIVRAHKGAIRVDTAPGCGSRFQVFFPVATSAVVTRARVSEEKVDLGGQGTVLVVDDEKFVRDLAKCSLERRGYEVLLAENGPAAIDAVRLDQDRIRLVVLDLSMPGMSGEETLPRLRELKPDLEVIVSSGFSQAEALRPFQDTRVSGFIQKPYTVQELARQVKLVLA